MQTKINYLGVWTLYVKEVNRFLKVFNQTLITPLVTSLLFLAIFSLALGGHERKIEGIPFDRFIGAGLIIMSVVQQSFANTSSSLIMGKVIGTITDILIPPLTAGEITFAMAMGGVTRGVLVGIIVTTGIFIFVPMGIEHPLLMIFYIICSALMLSLIGMLAGIFADSFDQMAAFTSYFITPLAFLSGTFYSVKALPEFWYHITHANPFFFMIDGFRYSLIGYSDSSILLGASVLVSMNVALWTVVYTLLNRGYRLKT